MNRSNQVIESPQALREAHAEFQRSLTTAEDDFKQLQKLDKQIKSFNVGPNPYTWFTMDALEETWRNLQKIIKVRYYIYRFLGYCSYRNPIYLP